MCDYCGAAIQDGYHIVLQCENLGNQETEAKIKDHRQIMSIITREDWNKWIFSQDEEERHQRRELLKMILEIPELHF